jgi:hypothetical protein
VVSPVLSNIYLNKLDEFVERDLIPRYTRGASRARNLGYMRIRARRDSARRRGDQAAARDLTHQMRTLPSIDPMDPGYRRLRYKGTQMTTSWGSSGRRPKPSRSRPNWRRSSGRPSGWNSARTRP